MDASSIKRPDNHAWRYEPSTTSSGFTLIDILIASFLLSTIVMINTQALIRLNSFTQQQMQQLAVRTLAESIIAKLRYQKDQYHQVPVDTNGTIQSDCRLLKYCVTSHSPVLDNSHFKLRRLSNDLWQLTIYRSNDKNNCQESMTTDINDPCVILRQTFSE